MVKFFFKGRILLLFCLLTLWFVPTFASADRVEETAVITLGNDLTDSQKKAMLDHFNRADAKQLVITNQEEHEALSGLLPKNVIGDKAISSSLVVLKEKGYGIQVTTDHINWVSPEMYAQALSTAGIEDAEIQVAAPYPVSGTAALTGIMKAFEAATDQVIDKEQKEAASEEMVLTAQLAEEKGDREKVLSLMNNLKKELAGKALNEQQMSALIDQLAAQIGLEITEEEKAALISLGMKIQELDIDWNQVLAQGEKMLEQAKVFLQENPETKSWIVSIWEQMKAWIDKFLANM